MIITGVPISFLLGIVGLLFDRNKKPALITLLLILLVLAFVLLR
jgi:hypothetical protein